MLLSLQKNEQIAISSCAPPVSTLGQKEKIRVQLAEAQLALPAV